MRSRNIEFVCQKLKPRTKFFAFFDGIAIPKKLITPKIVGVVKDPSTDSQTNNIPFQIGETVYVKKETVNLGLRQEYQLLTKIFQLTLLMALT